MSPVRGRPQARLAFLPRGRNTQMAKARDRQRGDVAAGAWLWTLPHATCPSPGSADTQASGVGWDDRQLAWAPLLLGPGSSVLVGLWGAHRDGTGQSHAGWVPPTQVPSSQRPRPWATLARPGTAQPRPPHAHPVQMPRHSTWAACHSQTCRPASQVGWAAQPCFWPLCPGGPGAVGPCPPTTKPTAG